MTRTDLIRLYAMFECQRAPYNRDVSEAVRVATARVDGILGLVPDQEVKSVSLPVLGTVGPVSSEKKKVSRKSKTASL